MLGKSALLGFNKLVQLQGVELLAQLQRYQPVLFDEVFDLERAEVILESLLLVRVQLLGSAGICHVFNLIYSVQIVHGVMLGLI